MDGRRYGSSILEDGIENLQVDAKPAAARWLFHRASPEKFMQMSVADWTYCGDSASYGIQE